MTQKKEKDSGAAREEAHPTTYCARHHFLGSGECQYCAQTVCENCHHDLSTENWGGTNDSVSLARNPSLIRRWCRRCVLTAQIAHMRQMVPRLAEAERELAALPTPKCKCPSFANAKGPYPSGFCPECGKWYPGITSAQADQIGSVTVVEGEASASPHRSAAPKTEGRS